MGLPLVIFTDLDGTLLEHDTYSFEAALPALDELHQRRIPVVISTSKTRAEVEVYRRAMCIADPFVVESGSAVFVPEGYFQSLPPEAKKRDGYAVIVLGAEYARILVAFRELKSRTGGAIEGLDEMPVERISILTGLPLEEARLAKQREYDEPFIFLRDEKLYSPRMEAFAKELGLRCQKGGRFYHLTGDSDKGKAMAILMELYRKKLGQPTSVALGDSSLDLPLLSRADIPIAVKRPDGSYDDTLLGSTDRVRKTDGIGSTGWNHAVLELLSEHD